MQRLIGGAAALDALRSRDSHDPRSLGFCKRCRFQLLDERALGILPGSFISGPALHAAPAQRPHRQAGDHGPSAKRSSTAATRVRLSSLCLEPAGRDGMHPDRRGPATVAGPTDAGRQSLAFGALGGVLHANGGFGGASESARDDAVERAERVGLGVARGLLSASALFRRTERGAVHKVALQATGGARLSERLSAGSRACAR